MEKPHLAVLSSLLSQTLIIIIILLRRRRPRKRRRLQPPPPPPPPPLTLALLPSPDPAITPFNMTSPTFTHLLSLLDPLLDARDPFPIPLPTPARLALALSRLATAAPYPALALHFSVPVPTARFLTRHLCRVLCTNFRFWLAFPPASPAPGCLGALARSRFGPVSAQIAAAPSSQIISIAAGFRAAATDSALLKSTSLYRNSTTLFHASQYLAGCGDYPLLPWLMVPYGETTAGSDEEGFNEMHRRMCRPVLRAAASLRKWGVLGRLEEEEDGKMAAALIGTCAILHNVLLMRDDYSALSDAAEECEAWKGVEGGTEEAVAVRRNLAAGARAVRESVCSL